MGPNAGKVLLAGGTTGQATLPSTELYDPVLGTWSVPPAAMKVPRRNHTATLLPNGRVLVTGGFTVGSTATSTVELYDPIAGTWTEKTPMSTARALHTATLLPQGTVLVAGGVSVVNGVLLASGEIYDPDFDTWTATGPMVTGHQAQTATLLQSGNVLIAGGSNIGAQQAELFDPAGNSWSATGNLTTARSFHGAALLPTGRVLVAGGSQLNTPLASAELYDPEAGTWSNTNAMSITRSGPAIVLLPNGTALIAGGVTGNTVASSAEAYVPSSSTAGSWAASGSVGTGRSGHSTTLLPTGQVLVAGGVGSDTSRLSSAVLFTPTLPGTAGTWTATGAMTTPRQDHTATVLTLGPSAGQVLAAGGQTTGGTSTETAELYSPASKVWTAVGSMAEARQLHTATLLVTGPNAGKILVAGGISNPTFTALTSAELFDPLTGTWTATGAMANPRGAHAAVMLTSGPNAGKVLVAGGLGIPVAGGLIQTDTAELYDPVAGTWSNTGSMVVSRHSFTLTMLPTGKVLAAAGAGAPDSAEIYDPATRTWSVAGNLLTARYSQSATVLTYGGNGGKVLAAGGADTNGFPIASSELYDPLADLWIQSGNLQRGRSAFTATLLPNGRVLAAGGDFSAVTATAELFNQATGTWSMTNPMLTGRAQHTAVLLPQGQVLIAGGNVGGAIGGIPTALAELYSSSIP
jgi:hypothetical protein